MEMVPHDALRMVSRSAQVYGPEHGHMPAPLGHRTTPTPNRAVNLFPAHPY